MKFIIVMAFVRLLTVSVEQAQAKSMDAVNVADSLLPKETPRDEKHGLERGLEEESGRWNNNNFYLFGSVAPCNNMMIDILYLMFLIYYVSRSMQGLHNINVVQVVPNLCHVFWLSMVFLGKQKLRKILWHMPAR